MKAALLDSLDRVGLHLWPTSVPAALSLAVKRSGREVYQSLHMFTSTAACLRSEVLTAVKVSVMVFWVVTALVLFLSSFCF